MTATKLDKEFLQTLEKLHAPNNQPVRLKWYLTVAIAVSGMNYAELLPSFYKTLLSDFIPEDQHKTETAKLREGLTKVCGIWGAAKVSKTKNFRSSRKIQRPNYRSDWYFDEISGERNTQPSR